MGKIFFIKLNLFEISIFLLLIYRCKRFFLKTSNNKYHQRNYRFLNFYRKISVVQLKVVSNLSLLFSIDWLNWTILPIVILYSAHHQKPRIWKKNARNKFHPYWILPSKYCDWNWFFFSHFLTINTWGSMITVFFLANLWSRSYLVNSPTLWHDVYTKYYIFCPFIWCFSKSLIDLSKLKFIAFFKR